MDDHDLIDGNIELLRTIIKALAKYKKDTDNEMVKAVYQEVCKDRRMIWISKSRGASSSASEATEKQINLIKKLDSKACTDGLSKADASAKIKELLK